MWSRARVASRSRGASARPVPVADAPGNERRRAAGGPVRLWATLPTRAQPLAHVRPEAQAGVTLVELLVASAIAAVLAVALTNIFSSVLAISRTAQAGRAADRQAQFTVGQLRQDVSGARRVLTVTATTLSLQAVDGSLVSYTLAGGDSLRRRVNGGAWRLVATDVDSLALGLQTVSRPYTREMLVSDTTEVFMRSFVPGDLDAWVASTHCNYESRGEQKIKDDDLSAVEFWSQPAGFFAFSRVEVRLKAQETYPPEVNTWVKIRQADALGWPGTVLAQGTLNRLSVPASYGWVSIALTPVVYGPINPTGHYWLIVGAVGSGSHTYAAHFEYERIKDCWPMEWPTNNACYWESGDDGGHWSGGSSDEDGFHRIYGLTSSTRLAEVTETRTDTLGVTYALVLRQGEEAERRAGYIALYNP
jgi:prepilin-type N-terminal cleavage/methylation domain-containing protein